MSAANIAPDPEAQDSADCTKKFTCTECPHFDRCSAQLCPLDPNWYRRRHLKGEPVCRYMLELVKPGGSVRLQEMLPAGMADQIEHAAQSIAEAERLIAERLVRASKQGSRIGRIRAVNTGRGEDCNEG